MFVLVKYDIFHNIKQNGKVVRKFNKYYHFDLDLDRKINRDYVGSDRGCLSRRKTMFSYIRKKYGKEIKLNLEQIYINMAD